LKPETAQSVEVGARMRWLDGKLDLDTSAFRMDFKNGLTYADDGAGNFGPSNGGQTRFRGIELEMRYTLSVNLRGIAHFASHDARFVRYTRDNGADASGNRVEMSPRQLGGIGLLYTRAAGFNGSLVANYSGRRMLNKSNSVEAGGYSTLDGSIGYSLGKWHLQLNGYNLTDRRDPVAESELQEQISATHTAGYYRLPGRQFIFTASVDF
jgi:iron complex outermembrane receptor protein